jgi:hypothetical protein
MIPVALFSARVAKAITERVPDGFPSSVTGKVAPAIDAEHGKGSERATEAKLYLNGIIDTHEMQEVLSTEKGYFEATSAQSIDDFKAFEQGNHSQLDNQRQADKAHEEQLALDNNGMEK